MSDYRMTNSQLAELQSTNRSIYSFLIATQAEMAKQSDVLTEVLGQPIDGTTEPPVEPPVEPPAAALFIEPEPTPDAFVITPATMPDWGGTRGVLGDYGETLRERILRMGGPDIHGATEVVFKGFTFKDTRDVGWLNMKGRYTIWLVDFELDNVPGGFAIQNRPSDADLNNKDGVLDDDGSSQIVNVVGGRIIDSYVDSGNTSVQVGAFNAQAGDQGEFNVYGTLFLNCGTDGSPGYDETQFDHGKYFNWNGKRANAVNCVFFNCANFGGKHGAKNVDLLGNTYINCADGFVFGVGTDEWDRSGYRKTTGTVRGCVAYNSRDLDEPKQYRGGLGWFVTSATAVCSDNLAANPVTLYPDSKQRMFQIRIGDRPDAIPEVSGFNNHAYGYVDELVWIEPGADKSKINLGVTRHPRCNEVDLGALEARIRSRELATRDVRAELIRQMGMADPMTNGGGR